MSTLSKQIPIENIIGSGEVAEILGVTKRTVYKYLAADKIPPPFLVVEKTPLWDREFLLKAVHVLRDGVWSWEVS